MTLINTMSLYLQKPLITTLKPKMTLKTTYYNPLIGSTLGLPLNLLQYIYCYSHYNENIIDNNLILMQFAIGIFTYGTDRLLDALQYNNQNNNNKISIDKTNYYNYLLENINVNISAIFFSYLYIFSIIKDTPQTYPLFALLTSTLFYKNFKEKYGEFKAIYIGCFWTFGTVILPCVLHDHNYEILNDPYIYLSSFFTMFASSNLLDIKDIDEDKEDNIITLPVLYGEKTSICLSHLSIVGAIILFSLNKNFYNNLWISSLYELQNIGSFFITYNSTYNSTNDLNR